MAEEKKTDLVEKKKINAYESFEAFMRVVNRHRPYEPSDFVPESFTPDLVIALLMALNFAVTPAKINTTEPKAKQVASATHRQSQVNCVNYFTVLQKTKGC